MKTKKHTFRRAVLISALIIFLLAVSFLLYVYFGLSKEIDLGLIRAGGSSVTRVYTFERENGEIDMYNPTELTEERIFFKNSEWCSIYDMPKNLINAFIAVEDHKFYEHNGVDWPRTIKATLNYIFKLEKSGFGGSTITQQLIKNLTGDNMVTPKRKIEEIMRAINLEKDLGKNEILELYLNVVYLSQNAYGVQSASRLYFGKDVTELTLAECASLASIVKSPVKYDPYANPENNESRRSLILNMMLSYGMISRDEYDEAIAQMLQINSKIEVERVSGVYSWFTEKLISDVARDLMKQYNLSYEGALTMINKGGLNIYSTMDKNVQDAVDSAFENYIAYLKPQNGKYPEGACVVLDPYTSDILGIAGGVGVKSANRIFNRATDAKRPLGSVIKPLSVYALGIENRKFTYASAYDDTPLLRNGELWPNNASGKYLGRVSINYALEHSINTVAVKALLDVGIENSFDFCKNKLSLNLSNDDKNEAPLALGQLTNGDSLLNTTNAYSIFANGGSLAEPRSYYYVTDNYGNILLSNDYKHTRVISEDTATIMNIMLGNVVKNGTGKTISLKDSFEVCAKTGTSGENKDKWFIGYTPHYLCGVWVGYDEPMSMSGSALYASSLFDAVMTRAHIGKDAEAQIFNSGNIVAREFCMDSGALASEQCTLDPRLNRVQVGYFIRGSEPRDYCDLHKEIVIDSQSGMIADENTNPMLKRKIALIDYNREPVLDSLDVLDKKYLLKSRIS